MKKHMKFTQKDADIVALKRFLPEGKFNETVIKILRAAVKGKVAEIPMEFEIVPFEQHPGTKIDLPEDLVQQLFEKFGERKFTTTVKSLIRQCIRQNLKEMPTKRISTADTFSLFEQTLKIADRNKGLPDGSEKYRQMRCIHSRLFVCAVLRAFQNPTGLLIPPRSALTQFPTAV